jgi:uncharacterized ferritin-like protein (DUF455 family)
MTTALRRAFLEPDPRAKATATLSLALQAPDPSPDWPDRPGRPERPLLVAARDVPKRSHGSPEGRAALLHALAHIELNAIDLALDIVGRFIAHPVLKGHEAAFAADWLGVAAEEAKHFLMLSDRLAALGSSYGAFSAHDGLWQTALRSKDDLLGRLAIAPQSSRVSATGTAPPFSTSSIATRSATSPSVIAGLSMSAQRMAFVRTRPIVKRSIASDLQDHMRPLMNRRAARPG